MHLHVHIKLQNINTLQNLHPRCICMCTYKVEKFIFCITCPYLTMLRFFPMLVLGYPSTHFKSFQPSMSTLVVFSHCIKCSDRQSHMKIFCCNLTVNEELFPLKLSSALMASSESLQCKKIINKQCTHKIQSPYLDWKLEFFLSLFSTFYIHFYIHIIS